MMSAFTDLADRQIAGPRKARQRTAEKRAAAKADHADTLRAGYVKWRAERLAALLTAPHGAAVRKLIEFLDRMALEDGAALAAFVEQIAVEEQERFEVLALIDTATIALRERCGLPPFDDPLPHEAPNVVLLVREALS